MFFYNSLIKTNLGAQPLDNHILGFQMATKLHSHSYVQVPQSVCSQVEHS